ncbi:sensor histidine kinase [Chitinimonas sp.]|uniref:sensor histidine kinase n=1 Tax=Chitinimonas sp. TaxID=1934313 RepID=UPI002F91D58C
MPNLRRLRFRLLRHLASAALLVSSLAQPAWALDSARSLAEYRHDIWGSKEGAPGGITALAQTTDGWLWLGTDTGLYRFDGVRFDAFEPLPGEKLLGKRIGTLFAARNGDLWISYVFGGLSLLRDGHLQHYPAGEVPIGTVYEIAVERDGTPWIASNLGLFHLQGKVWKKYGEAEGLPSPRMVSVAIDHYNQLWVGTSSEIYTYDRAKQRFNPTGEKTTEASLIESPDGQLWMSDKTKVKRLKPPPDRILSPSPGWANQTTAHNGLFDRDGNLWKLKCPIGLCRIAQTKLAGRDLLLPSQDATDKLDQPWQMSNLDPTAMLEDQEGNIWVGTWSGLERFRHNKLVPFPLPAGNSLMSLAADQDGRIRVVSTQPDGRLWTLSGTNQAIEGPQERYTSAVSAPDGSILLGSKLGITRWREGPGTRVPLPEGTISAALPPKALQGVMAMVDDGHGLWVTITFKGLYRYTNGQWQSGAQLGLPKSPIFMTADKQGTMWLGFRDNSVIRYRDGQIRRYDAADGLDVGAAAFIHAGKDLLVAGDNGMAVFKDGRFRPLLSDNPDLLANVSGLAVTADGDHWLNGAQGLVHVRAADWQAAMQSPSTGLRYELFNTLDGYPGTAQNLVRTPSTLLNTDGRIWLVGTAGLAWLDPTRLYRNNTIPPVQVTAVHTLSGRYRPQDVRTLPKGTGDLRIDYTALSYAMPERVRFRYRLEGLDHDWREAGTRRTAFYTNLPPGNYRFQVIASNEDGVWNQQGASLSFNIPPTFLQSRGFLLLCFVLAALLGYGLYHWRIRTFTARARIQLAERERIARALHDTLLQGMQGLILRFQGVANRLPMDAATQEQVARVLDQADEMLVAGRDQVMDLRLSHDLKGDLATALNEAGLCMAADHPASFTMRLEGEPQPLWQSVSDEAYSIGREALSNAFRHAGAGTILLSLVYGREVLTLTVSDDGKGVPVEVLNEKRRPGHWGLVGMRERATRIGGQLALHNRAGGGTEIVLTVPARFAYQAPVSGSWLTRPWRRSERHWARWR